MGLFKRDLLHTCGCDAEICVNIVSQSIDGLFRSVCLQLLLIMPIILNVSEKLPVNHMHFNSQFYGKVPCITTMENGIHRA